jgi:nucleotide-binding universal stress UspA family protein
MDRGVRTVLVATDLSPITGSLLSTAAQVGCRDGMIIVLHVYTPEDYVEVRRETGMPVDQFVASLRAEMQYQLEQAGLTAAAVHLEVAEGWSIPQQILVAADRLNADLIVLGTHGRTGIRRALVGSVAEEVLRHARRPVLVIPQAVPEAVPPREGVAL